ncbi:MAG: hypothetical protein MEQ84_06055 [Mesorhizobium sp.]|nr:hypothetical protein [Mesorhizobium sp.]
MGTENAPTDKGKKASEGLHESTRVEEHKVEVQKGSHLKKGEERFEERSKSSDGKGVEEKQEE